MDSATIENQARELRRRYQRAWYRRNRNRAMEYQKTYWLRRAEKQIAAEDAARKEGDGQDVFSKGN